MAANRLTRRDFIASGGAAMKAFVRQGKAAAKTKDPKA